MNGKASQYLEHALLDYVFGKTAFTPEAALYLALLQGEPVEDSGGDLTLDEADYTGYDRLGIVNTSDAWEDAVGRAKTNKVDFVFDECTDGENDLTHWAILDGPLGASGASVYAWGAITYNGTPVTKRVNAGDIPRILAGELEIEFVDAP